MSVWSRQLLLWISTTLSAAASRSEASQLPEKTLQAISATPRQITSTSLLKA